MYRVRGMAAVAVWVREETTGDTEPGLQAPRRELPPVEKRIRFA